MYYWPLYYDIYWSGLGCEEAMPIAQHIVHPCGMLTVVWEARSWTTRRLLRRSYHPKSWVVVIRWP